MSMITKYSLSMEASAETGNVSIIAEPSAGQSDKDLADFLKVIGAQDVVIVATGFVSASIRPEMADDILPVAHVELKARKEPLRAAL